MQLILQIPLSVKNSGQKPVREESFSLGFNFWEKAERVYFFSPGIFYAHNDPVPEAAEEMMIPNLARLKTEGSLTFLRPEFVLWVPEFAAFIATNSDTIANAVANISYDGGATWESRLLPVAQNVYGGAWSPELKMLVLLNESTVASEVVMRGL